MDMDDILRRFGFDSDDIFSANFSAADGAVAAASGGGARPRRTWHQPAHPVKMTLEEIATGVNKKIKVRKQVACNTCNGSGARDSSSVETCGTCRGSGVVNRVSQTPFGDANHRAMPHLQRQGQTIKSPATFVKATAAYSGKKPSMWIFRPAYTKASNSPCRAKAMPAPKAAEPGDLLITIEEAPHEEFTREGNNIMFELFVNIADAAMAHQVEVPTLDGRARITSIPLAHSRAKFSA
jgi:molecular chaperone DnaJ